MIRQAGAKFLLRHCTATGPIWAEPLTELDIFTHLSRSTVANGINAKVSGAIGQQRFVPQQALHRLRHLLLVFVWLGGDKSCCQLTIH